MGEVTVIRKASWVVAWDEQLSSHCYLKDADVAFDDNRIVHVAENYEGRFDREIPGLNIMVMPGLVNIHSHPLSEPLGKGFFEDVGNPRLGMSGLYDYMPVYGPDLDGMPICAEVAYAELLKSGVTTLVDLSVPYPGWLETLARSGLRGIVAPMHRSARWYSEDGHSVRYNWAEDGGEASFAAALEVIDNALNHESGRLGAMVTPAQLDTCTPELLKRSQAAARERGIPLQIHASQSLVEFQEITCRHGMTPLEWLQHLGLLEPDTIIAHCIFTDAHSWIYWGEEGDFVRLADSGASVAHCPNVFVRHGMLLESFAHYREAGITVGIGTDTFPHNMIEEMRLAALLSRVPTRRVAGSTTADVFEAATTGGAAAMKRDDIGRLTPGAKADLVLIDLGAPSMLPLRDPLRSLVFAAADRAVRDVFVDGAQVVAGGEVLTLDHAGASRRLDSLRGQAEADVSRKHWSGRAGDEVSPLTLSLAKDVE